MRLKPLTIKQIKSVANAELHVHVADSGETFIGPWEWKLQMWKPNRQLLQMHDAEVAKF